MKRGIIMSVVLGKDEKIVSEHKFKPNLILFWLKASYVLTDKRLTGSQPNVFLGLIPLGKAQVNQPLKTIASVNSGTKFYFKKFIIGLVLTIAGFAVMSETFAGGLIALIFGVVILLNSFMSTFVIMNNGGQQVGYSLSWLEKSKVQQFVNEINTVIAES